MNKFALTLGLIVGAFSWGVVSLVSQSFEPFDNSLGFYTGQFLLSVIAAYFGYQYGFKSVLFYLFGAYVGMNCYAYIYGNGETRAWYLLGFVTSLFLLVYPLISGVMGKLIQYATKKNNKSLNLTGEKNAPPS